MRVAGEETALKEGVARLTNEHETLCEEIPLAARVLSVADVLNALAADPGTHGEAIHREAAAGADLSLAKPFSPLDPLRLVDHVSGEELR